MHRICNASNTNNERGNEERGNVLYRNSIKHIWEFELHFRHENKHIAWQMWAARVKRKKKKTNINKNIYIIPHPRCAMCLRIWDASVVVNTVDKDPFHTHLHSECYGSADILVPYHRPCMWIKTKDWRQNIIFQMDFQWLLWIQDPEYDFLFSIE